MRLLALPVLLLLPSFASAQVPADVQFLHDMIMHHAQAIEMAHLVPDRSELESIKSLADRINVSQISEIQLMSDWLRGRGGEVPDTQHAGHMQMPGMLMPGMLTPAELDSLRNAKGKKFDRLFLTDMIKHHEGAVTMVDRLLTTPGNQVDAGLYQLANNIDVDQRAEIARMRALLSTLQ